MREETWYKMVIFSVALHFIIVAAFSIPVKKSGKKTDLSYYSVNLVGDMGGSTTQAQVAAPAPAPKAAPKPQPPVKEKQQETQKSKPVLQSKEKERSIAPKKKEAAQTTTKDEIKSLDEKIREMKKRQYLDIAGKREAAAAHGAGTGKGQGPLGLPTSSGGGSRPLDPALQKYMIEVWEKIQDAWHVPGLVFKKNLETVVSIKVRKDGRIVDMDIEKRSGNRVYDESVLRILRSIELLPPIPASLNTEYLEIGFNFHPPSDSR
jgi:TonB family protein